MTQKEIQLQTLQLLLQGLDTSLLERATDYVRGLIDASSDHKTDWWDELPDSVKEAHEEGLKDIEEGRLVPADEVLKKYRS